MNVLFDSSDFCHEYNWAVYLTKAIFLLTTIIIAIMNVLIRFVNIYLIKNIGFNYKSQEDSVIMKGVFYALFFNTGVTLVLCNANLSHTFLSFIPLNGFYPEYTHNWYIVVGPAIIQAMLVMAIFPYLNFTIFYSLRTLLRLYDSNCKCCCKHYKTKKTTIQQFVNLYAGPDQEMFWAYSYILNLVFVAFIHGIALPILFPIAFFGIFNNFVVERFLIARYYRAPPLYDNRLNNHALKGLLYAPLLMLANGYWVLGNR